MSQDKSALMLSQPRYHCHHLLLFILHNDCWFCVDALFYTSFSSCSVSTTDVHLSDQKKTIQHFRQAKYVHGHGPASLSPTPPPLNSIVSIIRYHNINVNDDFQQDIFTIKFPTQVLPVNICQNSYHISETYLGVYAYKFLRYVYTQ